MSGTSQFIDSPVLASNGLINNLGTVQWGGTLVQGTDLDGAFDLRVGNTTPLTSVTWIAGDITATSQLLLNKVGVSGTSAQLIITDSGNVNYSYVNLPSLGILEVVSTNYVEFITPILRITQAGTDKILYTPLSGNVTGVTIGSGLDFTTGTLSLSGPTGWGTPTGTLARTTFDSTTITHADLAQRVAALITDLKTTGIIKT